MTPEGFMGKTAPTIFLSGLLLLTAAPGRAADQDRPSRPETELKSAETEAGRLVDEQAERRIEARKELERIQKDLRYISEELDRETLEEESAKSLSEYASGGVARIASLRVRGEIDPMLAPVLDQLEALYRRLPEADYAKDYAGSLVKAINDELRWVAESSSGVDEKVRILKEDLVLPAAIAADGDVGDLAFFPEDLPLAKFLKLGTIKIFLAKHRLKRPKSYVVTTPQALISGKHHVQIGVDMEGTVTGAHFYHLDRDYSFDFGNLHMEITPEWRLLHKGMPMPKVGQKIRVKGWSYFDSFHGSELEYDPQDPVVGAERVTVWEVHPVQDIEILK
jgi:hypothetical protein